VDPVGDELFELLAPAVASFSLELVDVEVRPGLVRLVVDGPGGAQLDAIAEATRSVSHLLDAHDPQPGRRYTLEVTSPGVERPLRTPVHFARAVGETVSVRTTAGDPGSRRYTGKLVAADDDGIVLETGADAGTPDAGSPDAGSPDAGLPDDGSPDDGSPDGGPGSGGAEPAGRRRFAYADIERARTVFEWGGPDRSATGRRAHKPGPGAASGRATDRKKVTTS
jgi:ribosome maturation factor RimP